MAKKLKRRKPETILVQNDLYILWKDGHESNYDFFKLRDFCPCASCIDEITVLSPQNDSVSAVGDQVGHPNTTFTDIYDNTVAIHTSCSRCIYEGQEIEGWTILEIIDDGTLAEKCD